MTQVYTTEQTLADYWRHSAKSAERTQKDANVSLKLVISCISAKTVEKRKEGKYREQAEVTRCRDQGRNVR